MAAEAAFAAVGAGREADELAAYPEALGEELGLQGAARRPQRGAAGQEVRRHLGHAARRRGNVERAARPALALHHEAQARQ